MLDTRPLLMVSNFPQIKRRKLETLQVNLGYLCNLSCIHCHVNAGPNRTELMNRETVDQVLLFLKQHDIQTLDLTGGSPEMNPHFKYLVTEARRLGVDVIDRCNPTILVEPGYEDMTAFLAENEVIVTASLPCYAEQNVDKQRGKGVYEESIRALKMLNDLGYGKPGSGLVLNLVYNPVGADLPPPQQALEKEYKQSLMDQHGIEFNELFVITNMPISRFGGMLLARGEYYDYMSKLKDSYQPANLKTVMCRTLISVDWQGFIYDCDFNQMLDMPIIATDKSRRHLSEVLEEDMSDQTISVADHCYGCTAGQGSSCGGALV